jgi:hypothetical protein
MAWIVSLMAIGHMKDLARVDRAGEWNGLAYYHRTIVFLPFLLILAAALNAMIFKSRPLVS